MITETNARFTVHYRKVTRDWWGRDHMAALNAGTHTEKQSDFVPVAYVTEAEVIGNEPRRSISDGDVIVDNTTGEAFIIALGGWQRLGEFVA